jgi:hypothetical protein
MRGCEVYALLYNTMVHTEIEARELLSLKGDPDFLRLGTPACGEACT